jgi:hypothetical protein
MKQKNVGYDEYSRFEPMIFHIRKEYYPISWAVRYEIFVSFDYVMGHILYCDRQQVYVSVFYATIRNLMEF